MKKIKIKIKKAKTKNVNTCQTATCISMTKCQQALVFKKISILLKICDFLVHNGYVLALTWIVYHRDSPKMLFEGS